jgi:hypothetical protein
MRGVGQNGLLLSAKQGWLLELVVEDRLWALIDLAIGPEDQESSKSAREPAIVGHRHNGSFILIEGFLK